MRSAILFTSALLLPLVSSRRGGGGGGSSGSGGGGAQVINYMEHECYAEGLNPSYTKSNDTSIPTNATKLDGYKYYYIMDDKYDSDTTNFVTTRTPQVSWQMEVLDAYYNGSFTLTLEPPPPENNTYKCPTLKSPEIPDAFFRLGPQSRGNISRSTYGDKNPYYFHFGRTLPSEKCPQTPNKAFVNFESSNDNLEASQVWTLNQKKVGGDKFELDGTLTSPRASYNNFWNYVVNVTLGAGGEQVGADADVWPATGCPRTFSMKTMIAAAEAKMNASVTAEGAEFAFSFKDNQLGDGWTVSGSFSGKHWEQGPKLVFDGEGVATEGETQHVKPRAKKAGLWDRYGKWIMIVVAVLVVIFVLYILWKCGSCLVGCFAGCFACCRRAREKKGERNGGEGFDAGLRNDMAYKGPMDTVTATR